MNPCSGRRLVRHSPAHYGVAMIATPPLPPSKEDPPRSGAAATNASSNPDPTEQRGSGSRADARATKWGLLAELILVMLLYVIPGLTPTFGFARTVTLWTLVAWGATLLVSFFVSFALINRGRRAYFVPLIGCAVIFTIFVAYMILTGSVD